MLKKELLKIFYEGTSAKNQIEGQLIFNEDLVSSVVITDEENLIYINGNVISENLFNEYNTKIELDIKKKNIFSTFCSCQDFEKNELKKKNYSCKHLMATYLKALEELIKHPILNNEKWKGDTKFENNALAILLGDESDKDEIKIEVYLNKSEWNDNFSAEFKIGLKHMTSNNLYVLKDIEQFLFAYHNKISLSYSKNFSFQVKNQRFSTKDKRLIDFFEMLKTIEGTNKYVNRNENKIFDGKYVNIPQYLVREFLEVIRNHRVYLNEGFFNRPVETEFLTEAPNIDFDLKFIKGNYIIKSLEGMPIVLGSKKDVFLYGTTIYMPDYDFCYKISPYIKVFNESKIITIDGSEEERVLRRLIPDLNFLSSNVTLSKEIKNKIVIDKCMINFYFDQIDKQIVLTVKVKYGAFEFNIYEDYNEKIIYRDSKKEKNTISILKTLGFEEINSRFYLCKDDDYIFRFFKSEINRLQAIGEVYYSENFKGLKYISKKGITGNIKEGKYNYFELGFKIGDIPSEETTKILRAFRDNMKYYKLKNGEYLDLEDLELKKFMKLLDAISTADINNNNIIVDKSRSSFINDYLDENDIRYIKGKNELKEIREKLNNSSMLKIEVPADLKGDLRQYQRTGYNWLKTLDYLGFGGILGDEMGLGKTLQTITFILSNKGTKSLIIAPTSLIYNWLNEFEKFAPSIKVVIVYGLKDEREQIINNIGNYDVIITTYNILKRDIESYKAINFDYCILDEAQNIKNSNSQNAIAVKTLNAGRRFALSGTPIENSLMELWSIFDFIMPGYLYDEKRFSVRYHKKLKESPEVIGELNKLIKPFILRRKKRDVIKELPDKIETTLMVTMEESQKKVYKAYANYASELIEKRVREDEFKSSKIEILSYITKLRQLCLDPSVVMEDYDEGSGKIEALIELLEQSIEEGHKILVFSQFTSVLKNIGNRLNLEKIAFSYLDGTIPSEKRIDIVKTFNEGENSVFLISLKAGGTGLNLTSADIVVHFDPWWNPAVEEQATDRAHRIGQQNVVEVIKIIAKGTIEEKILALQEQKKKLIYKMMGDELSGGEDISTLTDEEILGLFES
jgi:SNF2 family DNA or RNA helicase